MTLQHLSTFKPDELIVHALYRTQDVPDPNTKVRVREFTRSGLTQALGALEVAECVGTSGFTTREDILLATTSPKAVQQAKGA
jgi:hypothetical protein